MIEIIRKEDCCGCTACASICPRHCITMQADFEGFLYPEIEMEKCINCGLCRKTCPIDYPVMVHEYERITYALRVKTKNILMDSTSGGFVTPLAKYVISNGGIFCAASYDEKKKVIHQFIGNSGTDIEKAIENVRGSKYVQSDLDNTFLKVREYLKENKQVCFVGTPCQVNGLLSFLKEDRDSENLITVDLACHGTPSPKLWDKYLDYQTEKYHSEIKEIHFRNKTYGYHSATMKIEFQNGKVYYGSQRIDYMLRSFFKEISSRPSCYHCRFKHVERCSDFTLFDCWHAGELIAGLQDDDCGYTNVIIQSKKGEKVFEEIRKFYDAYKIDTQSAVRLDGVMINQSAIPHPKRKEYYKSLAADTLPEHIRQYIPIHKKDIVIEKMKAFLYGMGIFQTTKKYINQIIGR